MLYTYNLTLADTTVRYEAGKLNFTPTCSLDLLKEQKKYMGLYLNKLEIRAFLEDINLAKPFMINNNMEG